MSTKPLSVFFFKGKWVWKLEVLYGYVIQFCFLLFISINNLVYEVDGRPTKYRTADEL